MFGRKERKTPFVRKPATDLEDLRDDCIALFIDSGLTQEQVHANGGPTPGTISKWLYKETKFPRLDTMRALVQALGGEMVIMSIQQAIDFRQSSLQQRLGLSVAFAGKPRMPVKRKRKKT